MKLTPNLELIKTLLNNELVIIYKNLGIDPGTITLRYADETHKMKLYHTNILQRILNKIFGTAYQTVKTLDTRLVLVTLTTHDNKQYTTGIAEVCLVNIEYDELINDVIIPMAYKFKMAIRKDKNRG